MKKELILIPLRSPWLSGQLAIWLFLLIGSLIVALLLRFTSFDANYLPLSTSIIHTLSLIGGGFISGKISGRKGWYFGGLQGIIYTLFLLLIGFLAFDKMININPFLFVICAFGLSSIGGILGEHHKK